jgi:hypothetical protein
MSEHSIVLAIWRGAGSKLLLLVQLVKMAELGMRINDLVA